MIRLVSVVGAVLFLWAGLLLAQDGIQKGKVKKIDLDKKTLTLTTGDKDIEVALTEQSRVLGVEAKDLKERFQGIKAGMDVFFKVETRDGKSVLVGIKPAGAGEAPAQAGGKTSVGFKPLTEMTATDKYKGEDGGLYGGGKNEPPESHAAAAKKETAKIVPLDADGKPAKDGNKIVLVSISMSNATQEFSKFKQIADADPDKSPFLTIVDCAQGGQAMAQWVPPNARPWTVAEERLAQAKVTPKQVQVAWIKLANVGPTGELNEHGKKLQKDTLEVIKNAKSRFPNLRVAYLSSRIYAGYGTGRLNPEPYAYEGAFPVRWLIQDQIKGDDNLSYTAGKAPLLLWGPYLWADGTTPRKSDGLIYERSDLAGDGIHPSESGRKKVADQLLKFFKTDPYAKTWFVKQ
jgi:Cu/Ag efflux protein CusF